MTLVLSAGAKTRLRVFSFSLFVVLAALGWWTLAEEGASKPRVIAAVASSAAVIAEAVAFARTRSRMRRSGGARTETEMRANSSRSRS